MSTLNLLWYDSLYPQGLVYFSVNPISPNSDENETSLYIFTTCLNIQVMRIKEVITKDKMS